MSIHRLFEIFPGALAWATLLIVVLFSWLFPVAVAVFIILFDVYWLLKTIYLSLHIRATFSRMKENIEVNWLEKVKSAHTGRFEDIYHLIIFPMHREPYEVVRESFESLREVVYPKEKLLIVLGIEETGGEESKETAEKIKKEFGHVFGGFLVTAHPSGLPGEIPGKGSNETWAARHAKKSLIDLRNIPYDRVIVSVFDVDTQVPPHYFGRLTSVFLSTENPLRAIYQPIPLFVNNVYQAPPLARVTAFSATFWQMMQQARPERLTTFSSQSIPFRVLLDIGFWHTDVVSEDSRIFWQCYLHYDGDFRVVPLEYPVYMDANVTPTFWGTMKNIYKQQRRWGWGVENIPYMLEGFKNNPRISRSKKWHWTFHVFEGFHSWATNALMVFALGWLPVILGGVAFNALLLSYSLPRITRTIITLSMIGVATSAVLSILLLPPKPEWFRKRHYFLYALEWLLLPVTLIVFGAFPGLEAQTRLALGGKWRLGFWVTPKMREASSE